MTFREKAEYLWEYYKWVLLVAAFAVVVISMVVTGIVNNSGQVLYSGAVVNVQLSEEGGKYLTEDLEAWLGADKKQDAELFVTSFEELQSSPDTLASSASAMQVVLMITAGEYDYVLMDTVAFDFYKNHPVFTSLDQLFDQKLLTELETSVIYHETEEDGRYPIALDITDTAFARGCAAEGERVTGRTEENDDFLAYLMAWE